MRDLIKETIRNAEKSKVELIVTAGIDVQSSKEAVDLASKYERVKGCVGIHPWRADTFTEEALETLKKLAQRSEVVGISEIGLDYVGRRTKAWEFTDEYVNPEIQKTALKSQISLAKELDLPVLVHDRTANQEILDVLEEENITRIGAAIHGFSKDPEYAKRCVETGIYLSIGKRPLEAATENFIEAIVQTPLDWLLTETDSGDPTGVLFVAEKIAEIKGTTKEKVGRTTTHNLKKLINI